MLRMRNLDSNVYHELVLNWLSKMTSSQILETRFKIVVEHCFYMLINILKLHLLHIIVIYPSPNQQDQPTNQPRFDVSPHIIAKRPSKTNQLCLALSSSPAVKTTSCLGLIVWTSTMDFLQVVSLQYRHLFPAVSSSRIA